MRPEKAVVPHEDEAIGVRPSRDRSEDPERRSWCWRGMSRVRRTTQTMVPEREAPFLREAQKKAEGWKRGLDLGGGGGEGGLGEALQG